MKSLKTMVWFVSAAGAVLSALPCGAAAEAKPNPYVTIVDRNPFGLKPPPVAPDPQPVQPAAPPAKVVLTGITSLFGPTSKRCFLEITEQEPGKAANVVRPILQEGESQGSVEVLSIDVEKNMVRIKNGGQELDLKFEDPSKVASVAPRPVIPGTQFVPPPSPFNAAPQPPPQAAAPTIISPDSAENSMRNSSVSMFGNQANPAPAPGAVAAANGGIPPALGRQDGGARIIPSRPIRSSSIPQPPPVPGYPVNPPPQLPQ